MSRLRPFLIVLLVLATLPWRAHLVVAGPVAVGPSLEAASEDGAPVSAAEDQGAKAFALNLPCPGPKLPGSVCSSPLAILPSEASLPAPPASGPPVAAETRHRDLWQPEDQTDPPRSC